ncbi:MAG: hypothetical protein PT977_14275, partial [Acidobacteriota bacterium]|nr:hypothetical protein [Acidobacteriota bacterium]
MRRAIVTLLLVGALVQLAGLLVAAFSGPGLRASQSEDMVPFTYLLATIASVAATSLALAFFDLWADV